MQRNLESGFIAVISHSEFHREWVSKELRLRNLDVRAYSSISDMQRNFGKEPYLAFWVDLRSILGANSNERVWITSIEELFPFIKVIEKTQSGEWSGAMPGGVAKGQDRLIDLLIEQSRGFSSRSLRRHARTSLSLNCKLNGNPATTINVSETGMFITNIGPEPKYKIGEKVAIEIADINRSKEISSQVIWVANWDLNRRQPPGIGIQFENISEQTQLQLRTKFGLKLPWEVVSQI